MSIILHKQKETLRAIIHKSDQFLLGILLALVFGIAIGIVTNYTGMLALLVFPGLLAILTIILKPDIGLSAFIFVVYVQLSNVLIKFHGIPSIAQPMAGLLLIVVIVQLTFYEVRPPRIWKTILVLGLYVLVSFSSVFVANDFLISINTFSGFLKDLLGGVLVFLLIQRSSSFRIAIWTLILAGLLMGSISVFQYLSGTFDNLYWGFGGWISEVSGNISRERLTGPYSNPNAYSQVLIMIIPLALERIWHERNLLLRILAGVSLFVSSLTIIFTFSRGGFITTLFTVGIFLVLFRPRFLPLLTMVAILAIFMQYIPKGYIDRVNTIAQLSSSQPSLVTDQSFLGRISENTAAWRMFIDHPVLGVGIGNFPVNYQDYSREIGLDSRRDPRTPASLYLQILSEQGFAGITAFLIMMFYFFRYGLRACGQLSKAGQLQEASMMKAFLAGLFGYLIAAVVKNNAYSNVFWMLLGIGFGAIHLARGYIDEMQVSTVE